MSDDFPRRYALYWAPQEGSDLARLGGAWLGLRGESNSAGPPPPIPGFDALRIHVLTAEPRRYGLHATLKPPFALANGTDLASLRQALDAAKVTYEMHIYDGAAHAFFNDTGAAYNAAAAKDAWIRTLDWFGRWLE